MLSKIKIEITKIETDDRLLWSQLIVGGIGSTARTLETEEILIELIQWMGQQSKVGIILAKVSLRLIAAFEPFIIDTEAVCRSNLEILVDRTDYFPVQKFSDFLISKKISITSRYKNFPIF